MCNSNDASSSAQHFSTWWNQQPTTWALFFFTCIKWWWSVFNVINWLMSRLALRSWWCPSAAAATDDKQSSSAIMMVRYGPEMAADALGSEHRLCAQHWYQPCPNRMASPVSFCCPAHAQYTPSVLQECVCVWQQHVSKGFVILQPQPLHQPV